MPEVQAGERLPLVVLLHGLGATGEQTVQQLDVVAFAQQKRFVYVAPDGMQDPTGRRFWNAGPACCDFFGTGVDDSARLRELIAHAVKQLPVDGRRVYVVGYSNGGFMAHQLACTHSEHVAAIVSIAGSGPVPQARCEPRDPVAVLEIHGDRDPIVPMKGGHLFGRSELPKIAGLRDSLQPWTEHNGCSSEVRSSDKLDLVPDVGGKETERAAFRDCNKAPVELWTVQGGAHYLALHSEALGHIWGFLAAQAKK